MKPPEGSTPTKIPVSKSEKTKCSLVDLKELLARFKKFQKFM